MLYYVPLISVTVGSEAEEDLLYAPSSLSGLEYLKYFLRIHVYLSTNLCLTLWNKANSYSTALLKETKTDRKLLLICTSFRFHQKSSGARGYNCTGTAKYTSHRTGIWKVDDIRVVRNFLTLRHTNACWPAQESPLSTYVEATPPCRIFTNNSTSKHLYDGYCLVVYDAV
jgi:hypothetical protein